MTAGANTSAASSSGGAAAKKKAGSAAAAAAAAAAKNAGTSVSMSAKKGDAAANSAIEHTASSGDLFARSVSMMAIAHIARGAGFDTMQRSAGDALVEILAKYIQRVGGASKDIAELAGRTQPRATDVLQALSDMLPMPVELPDLVKALETAKRPFPRDVPSFPARKRDAAGNAIEQASNAIGSREALPPHVPSFLPPLPNRHTYSSESRVVVERDHDTKRTRLDLLGQKSQIQQSLHGLQSVFTKKPVAMVLQPSWNAFQGAATGESASENPFVQPPVVAATGADTPSLAKSVFAAPERAFAPNAHKAPKKSALMDTNSVSIPKMANNQELGKEEKILLGTFHDGDSE